MEAKWDDNHPHEIVYVWITDKGFLVSNHQLFRLKDIDSKISNLRLRYQIRQWLKDDKIGIRNPPKECEIIAIEYNLIIYIVGTNISRFSVHLVFYKNFYN